MCKSQEKFTGMMIILKKRLMCLNQDDTDDYRYLMFGHYDGMDKFVQINGIRCARKAWWKDKEWLISRILFWTSTR